MTLFFIGVVEMLIVAIWTKMVSGNQVLAGGAITVINILIWYYVLETIIKDINNWQLVLLYATGCAVGTMGCSLYFKWRNAIKKTAGESA
ncbi:MAG: hypothetical protein COU29_00890 [Candidatus Magasanikbacteria bacterium CG10_big_fil_rev_8_21_14_0_10_36_32]|uniref:DUF5698 domain-containing protein n=1 Tax=Candidatus Magasanikbacteria bacterium CG10_big_fil_rev_8_21_14_0_10_36_32 TaxID=1974646 RepID=A0A2M6W6B2_9BACT|nr:MAG: hypothetical protein COU29_00890 [Candidatus Magasanikbacteria bacterium CG10_big_fil_rev_8_21_14_0_10_36_32]